MTTIIQKIKDWENWKPDNYDSLSPFKQLIILEQWIYLKKHENAPRVINITVDEPKKDVVKETMAIFENERLNPVSRIDRSRAGGWIDCAYYDETITLEQRDELYKKMGIE